VRNEPTVEEQVERASPTRWRTGATTPLVLIATSSSCSDGVRFARVMVAQTIEWLNSELTRAKVTREAAKSRWWRRRYVVAEVERRELKNADIMDVGHRQWHFVVGGDRVYDHDPHLASKLEERRREGVRVQARLAEVRRS
jgi:hypothetical protein